MKASCVQHTGNGRRKSACSLVERALAGIHLYSPIGLGPQKPALAVHWPASVRFPRLVRVRDCGLRVSDKKVSLPGKAAAQTTRHFRCCSLSRAFGTAAYCTSAFPYLPIRCESSLLPVNERLDSGVDSRALPAPRALGGHTRIRTLWKLCDCQMCLKRGVTVSPVGNAQKAWRTQKELKGLHIVMNSSGHAAPMPCCCPDERQFSLWWCCIES